MSRLFISPQRGNAPPDMPDACKISPLRGAGSRLSFLAVLLLLLPAAGCFNSEKDYELLVEEKNNLAVELQAANRENEILNRALENIKREQEALQILLNTNSRAFNTGVSGGSAPLPPAGGEASPTISWGGWEWSIPPDALPDPTPPPARQPAAQQSAPAPPASSGRVYQPRPGDVLSSIAARNNTTVEELVELNPYLKSRRNYMIWETDRIRLP